MKNAVSAEKYAAENNMIKAQVIREIKEGDLMGTLYRGTWFVTGVMPSHPDSKKDRAKKEYIAENKKSPGMAFFLALLFGPIGALYGSILGGVILLLLVFVFIPGTGYGAAALIWIASMIVAPMGANMHNDKLVAKTNLMAEMSH